MGKCYPDAFLWTGSQFGEVKTTVWQCNKGLQGNTISRPAVPYHPSPACLLSQSQSCHRVLACHSDDSDSSGTVYFCLPSSTAETYPNRNGIARKSRSLSKLKTKSFTNRYLDIYPFSRTKEKELSLCSQTVVKSYRLFKFKSSSLAFPLL